MFHERDNIELGIQRIRALRAARSREDRQVLHNSWRALTRSHRLLDHELYRLNKDGELHVEKYKPPG